MEPLSLVVWAVFFYSLSMFPLGIMLGSSCCHCENRVECFSPTHRCFRTLQTSELGEKFATSSVAYVHFGHRYLNTLTYLTPSVGASLGYQNTPYSSGVFCSHESFEFQHTIRVRYANQLSKNETIAITPTFAARGRAHLVDGQCTIGPIINAPVSLQTSPSVVMHGWDFPLLDFTPEVWLDHISTTSGATLHQSDPREWKQSAWWSKNASVTHSIVGLELSGPGVAAAATAEQIKLLLQVQLSADGSYVYSVTIPAGMFDYTSGYGAVKWTVRVYHGTAFHDEVVAADVWSVATPDPLAPVPPLLTAGVYIEPPPASNPPPPASYFDAAVGVLHVWPYSIYDSQTDHGPFTLSGTQTQLLVVNAIVATSYTLSGNPLGWGASILDPSSYAAVVATIQGEFTFPEGAYFHRPFANAFNATPCYTRDSSAVAAYMAGEAGLVYSISLNGLQRQEEYRLDADNPLCGLPLTHLPTSLLPETITVSTGGQPLYQTRCNDCPSSVSMKRVSNDVYFYPAADMHLMIYGNYGTLRQLATGSPSYYDNGGLATPFAVSLAEVIGHTDAIAYLESFYRTPMLIGWTSGAGAVTAEVGGEDFPEGFDTPIVKHVTSHEATPRTIGVHGHKGVYPPSSYKVEVAISDVEVVAEWERTFYAPEYSIIPYYWGNNGRQVGRVGEWQEELVFDSSSNPPQQEYDLPNPHKQAIIDAILAAPPEMREVFLFSHGTPGPFFQFQNPLQSVMEWAYNNPAFDIYLAAQMRLKCDGSFEVNTPLTPSPAVPAYTVQKQEDGEGHIFGVSRNWAPVANIFGTYSYPPSVSLADDLPPSPDEIPEEYRSADFTIGSQSSSFSIPSYNTMPLPPPGQDSYEVCFYQSLSTWTVDAQTPSEPYTTTKWNGQTYNGNVEVPGTPQQSEGVYLLKITLAVTVTKGDPPSDSCGINVHVGKPETTADETLSKEDVTFTFSTDCTLPQTFRGHIWPHAGSPLRFNGSNWNTSLSEKNDGHVFHLTENDPNGTADDQYWQPAARTAYPRQPFSPVNVGETLYPYVDSTSFRPAIREGEWQGHIYVQGEQYDDLTYSYQFTSLPYIDRCETNKANWMNIPSRSTLRAWQQEVGPYGDDTTVAVRNAQSRDAQFTAVGYFAPDEKVRVGYISHKQYGIWSTSGPETYPESGWRSVSRYVNSTSLFGGFFPPGMMTIAGEATCDADGKFTYDFSSTSASGDLSLFFQPVNPQTGRGLLEYVRSKPALDDFKERWDVIGTVYVVRSIPQPTISPLTYSHSGSIPLSGYAVPGGYVVKPFFVVSIELSGVVRESSVGTSIRIVNTITGRVIKTLGVGTGDFATGTVPPFPVLFYPAVTDGIGNHGEMLQIAAVVYDDLGNESPPALLSGLIRIDDVAPSVTGLAVNGLPADGTVILNDVSKQSPVVVSGFTEPGCKVSIGTSVETAGDTVTSAGTVTVSSVTGNGAFSLSTQTFSSLPSLVSMGRTLFVTDVAGNLTQQSVSVWNLLPVVVSATISGGLLECKLNYVQTNASVSVTFLRSDGESSPVLTPEITGSTGEVTATFVDTGFSVDFTYGVQISVVLPNGQSVFSEQRNVVPA